MTEKIYFQINAMTGEFINESVYNAWYGFDRIGLWTEKFIYQDLYDGKIELGREIIIVGGIKSVRETIEKLGYVPPNNMDYPNSLKSYLGRNIYLSNIGEIRKQMVDDKMDPSIFIKPAFIQKDFTGHVISKYRDLIKTAAYPSEYEVWVSDKLNFVSEYRFFIHRNEVVGVGFYNGNPLRSVDGRIVEKAMKDFKKSGEAPISYCLDFGLTDRDETILIEVNDGFAFGSYGLSAISHANMLEDRWREMVKLPTLNRI